MKVQDRHDTLREFDRCIISFLFTFKSKRQSRDGALSAGGWEVAAGRKSLDALRCRFRIHCRNAKLPSLRRTAKEVFLLNKRMFTVKEMVLISALVAMEIVLSRFLSFNVWNMKIGLAFAPIVVAAILLGPWKAAITAGIADLVGALLFPSGTFFPGFTLTAALIGLVYGIFLYKKQTLPRILMAVGINQLIFSLLLNSLWISILYGAPYVPLLVTRLSQVAILVPVQIIIISLLARTLPILQRRLKLSS